MTKHRQKTQKRAHNPKAFGADLSQDKTLLRATLHGTSSLTSSAGGVINTYVPLDPSAYAGTDWADFSSTYDEFRVMGIRLRFFNHQFGVAVNGGPVAVAFDNDSSGANPGSYTAVRQYSTSHVLPAVWYTKPISMTWWRPTRGAETTINWVDVANPSSTLGSVLFYSSGLSASAQYLDIDYEFFVEFRGRR